MNVYIDTEFNGYQGALISMALVDADGREFYAALGPLPAPLDPWVVENVIPVLDAQPMPRAEFQQLLAWWLAPYPAVHIIADWPDDIRHFCDALITGPGTRIDTPPLTLEIRRDLDAISDRPHNALADAHAIRRKAMRLPAWERQKPQPTPTIGRYGWKGA